MVFTLPLPEIRFGSVKKKGGQKRAGSLVESAPFRYFLIL